MLVINQQWVQAWLDKKIPTEENEVHDFLLQQGFELEPVDSLFTEDIIVGEILEVNPHPNADKLNICQVAIAPNDSLEIICGCSSVKKGIKVAVAQEGVQLGEFKIVKRKIRGIESNGMLCSMKELGFKITSPGIWHLDPAAPVGCNLDDWLKRSSYLYGIEITPNRGDCLSVRGMAREFALGLGCDAQAPWSDQKPSFLSLPKNADIQVDEAAKSHMDAMHLVRLERDQSKALLSTPDWMKARLVESGFGLHHCVVDVLNYVMLETGQPMHAYGATVTDSFSVSMGDNQQVTMLNSETARLDNKTLVIHSDKSPVCIAGYMGTESSAAARDDLVIYLEAANFHSQQIAYHCRKYVWHTQSGSRFERGIDFQYTVVAMQRAIDLLKEYAGFSPVYRLEYVGDVQKSAPISISAEFAQNLLGFSCKKSDLLSTLERSGCLVDVDGDNLFVETPAWRNDLQIPESLVAEFLRLNGMPQRDQSNLLATISKNVDDFSKVDQVMDRLKELMAGFGFFETFSYSFSDMAEVLEFCDDEDSVVSLQNPISSVFSVMRTALFPGLLRQLKRNLAKQTSDVRLFEMGRCFHYTDKKVVQEKMLLGTAFTGRVVAENWLSSESYQFHHAKSLLRRLIGAFSLKSGSSGLKWVPSSIAGLHPHQSGVLSLAGRNIGSCGLLHPQIAKALKINQDVFLMSLDVDWLVENLALDRYASKSNQPTMRRDLSLVVPDSVPYSKIKAEIQSYVFKYLKKIVIFDMYNGDQIPSGFYSVSIGLLFQDEDRTLQDDDLAPMLLDLKAGLEHKFNIKYRGGNE